MQWARPEYERRSLLGCSSRPVVLALPPQPQFLQIGLHRVGRVVDAHCDHRQRVFVAFLERRRLSFDFLQRGAAQTAPSRPEVEVNPLAFVIAELFLRVAFYRSQRDIWRRVAHARWRLKAGWLGAAVIAQIDKACHFRTVRRVQVVGNAFAQLGKRGAPSRTVRAYARQVHIATDQMTA